MTGYVLEFPRWRPEDCKMSRWSAWYSWITSAECWYDVKTEHEWFLCLAVLLAEIEEFEQFGITEPSEQEVSSAFRHCKLRATHWQNNRSFSLAHVHLQHRVAASLGEIVSKATVTCCSRMSKSASISSNSQLGWSLGFQLTCRYSRILVGACYHSSLSWRPWSGKSLQCCYWECVRNECIFSFRFQRPIEMSTAIAQE